MIEKNRKKSLLHCPCVQTSINMENHENGWKWVKIMLNVSLFTSKIQPCDFRPGPNMSSSLWPGLWTRRVDHGSNRNLTHQWLGKKNIEIKFEIHPQFPFLHRSNVHRWVELRLDDYADVLRNHTCLHAQKEGGQKKCQTLRLPIINSENILGGRESWACGSWPWSSANPKVYVHIHNMYIYIYIFV